MTGFLLALLTSLYFPGLILRVKSIFSGRKGPGIMQPWKNILVLVQKRRVVSSVSSYVFSVATAVYLASIITAILLVPVPGVSTGLAFEGDFVMFAYLLALGKFLLIISSLDTGSSFEGMGASREALYGMLAEPAFFILFGTLGLITGHVSMQEVFSHFELSSFNTVIIGVLAAYILMQIAMVENSRMPVDDPKTHLELTMIHEVMVLDHSGFDLAMVHFGNALKFAMYGALISDILVPATIPVAGRIALYFCVQAVFAGVIGFAESFRARKKMIKNPQFIQTLSVIALVAFILGMLLVYKLIG